MMAAAMVCLSGAAGCGAADRVGEAADEIERATQRVECVADEEGVCPTGARAWELIQLAVDDCYEVLSIDSEPDGACCFAVSLELSVDAAVDCI